MGAIGKNTNSNNVIFDLRTDAVNHVVSQDRKDTMLKAVKLVQDAINAIMSDSLGEPIETWYIYGKLADYFPHAFSDDESKKVLYTSNGFITSVGVQISENKDGKFTATLEPYSDYYDEFSDEDLRSWGVEI